MPYRKRLSLNELYVDKANPRMERKESERAAIQALASSQPSKLKALAADIADSGLDPMHSIGVIPDTSVDVKDAYVVVEGNRRVSALKLLETPMLAEGAVSDGMLKEWSKLSNQFHKAPITSIEVIVFDPSEDDYRHWIRLRHTGENDGVGVVKWSPEMQRRFDNEKSPVLQLYRRAIDEEYVSEAARARLSQSRIFTTFERVVEDPEVQKRIGMELRNNGTELYSVVPDKTLLGKMGKIIDRLTDPKVNVGNVYHKQDRESFIVGVLGKNVPKPGKMHAFGNEDGKKAAPAKKSAKRKKPTRERTTIVPDDFVLSIPQARINDLYDELKRLNVNDFPNAAAALIRIFVELSVEEYIEANGSNYATPVRTGDGIKEKLKKTARYMQDEGDMSEEEARPIYRYSDDTDSMFSKKTFNAYIHDRTSHPAPGDLKLVWNSLQPFIVQLWS